MINYGEIGRHFSYCGSCFWKWLFVVIYKCVLLKHKLSNDQQSPKFAMGLIGYVSDANILSHVNPMCSYHKRFAIFFQRQKGQLKMLIKPHKLESVKFLKQKTAGHESQSWSIQYISISIEENVISTNHLIIARK